MPPKGKKKGARGGKSRSEELLEAKRAVFIPPVWTSSRPKPLITDAAWEPQTKDEIARYVDWHGRHPHMTSPRDGMDLSMVKGQGRVFRDEDNPKLIYMSNNAVMKEKPPDYTPTLLGADGNFEDVSIVGTVYERQANLAGGLDSDDPWYTMSVKDRLEQYHIDGDHTTQKTRPKRPPAKTETQLKFEKEQAWQKAEYGSYGGGGPAFEGAKRVIIEALSLANPSDKFDEKKKVGPWESDYVFTKYTKGGTNLLEFNQIEVEKRVEKALETFRAMSASKPVAVGVAKDKKKKAVDGLKNVMAAGMGALFGGGGAQIAPSVNGQVAEGADSSSGSPGGPADAEATSLAGKQGQGEGQGEGEGEGEGGDEMSLLTMDDNATINSAQDNDDMNDGSEAGTGTGGKRDGERGGEKKMKKKKRKGGGEARVDFMEELQLSLESITEERDALGQAEQDSGAVAVVDPDAALGKYELMVKKMGGDEACALKAEEWVKFAELVRRKAKRDTDLFDTSTDLYDACNQGNLVKVLYILGVLGVDPNTIKTPEDEPLIIHMVNKIIVMDDISGSLHDSDGETPDRLKAHRVVQALIKFGTDPTTLEGKGGLGAVHLAAQANNSKLLKFLCENGCKGTQWTQTKATGVEPINSLNIAAKFGYVQVIATLLRLGVPIDTKDELGRTALHWAGFYGQTRTALFLLQCGSDKRIMDKRKQSPGILAEDVGYVVTGQTILTYTVPAFQSMTVLRYYSDRLATEDAAEEAAKNSLAAKLTNLGKLDMDNKHVQRLAKLGESFTAFVGSAIRATINLGRRALGLKIPDNTPGSAGGSAGAVDFHSFK